MPLFAGGALKVADDCDPDASGGIAQNPSAVSEQRKGVGAGVSECALGEFGLDEAFLRLLFRRTAGQRQGEEQEKRTERGCFGAAHGHGFFRGGPFLVQMTITPQPA